jgi:MbtH protein
MSDQYAVVMNEEEQYSIRPLDQPPKPGWHDVGKTGTRSECLAYIDEVWVDMRPKSLRDRMRRQGQD